MCGYKVLKKVSYIYGYLMDIHLWLKESDCFSTWKSPFATEKLNEYIFCRIICHHTNWYIHMLTSIAITFRNYE